MLSVIVIVIGDGVLSIKKRLCCCRETLTFFVVGVGGVGLTRQKCDFKKFFEGSGMEIIEDGVKVWKVVP